MWEVKIVKCCAHLGIHKTHLTHVVNVVATGRCCLGAILFCRDVAVVVFVEQCFHGVAVFLFPPTPARKHSRCARGQEHSG